MLVVSDTWPLLSLATIGRLHLLRHWFGQVSTATEVVKELRVGEDLPGSEAVRGALDVGWIQVVDFKDQALVKTLQRDLNVGEAEASALALQVKADRVLLDEREGRRVAKTFCAAPGPV